VTGGHTCGVKQHREFYGLAIVGPGWESVADHPDSITQLVLADNLDASRRSGSRTRLIRWLPGTLLPTTVEHDYSEEVLVLEGDLVVGCDAAGMGGEVFERYAYCCRPPGIAHGPFTTRTGCVMLEIDSYD
jgi:hypothetical protein